jgi:hypothetical protein
VRRAFTLTKALYLSMLSPLALTFFSSSRVVTSDGLLVDTVFPMISMRHAPGTGLFVPGTFALSFFLPSLLVMVLLNGLMPGRFAPLKGAGANVFFYICGLLVAIMEVAADTLLPILDLRGSRGFTLAVLLVQAGFYSSILLATTLSVGADREW